MRAHDLIIIGGGISGLGVAAAATARGMRPLVLEAGRCVMATSNNSLRIIHGGFRYLQNLHIPRVIRSLQDQSYVFNTFRDAVEPLPCLMPLAPRGLKSKLPVSAAALTYGAIMKLSGSPIPSPSVISAREVAARVPTLSSHARYGALCWYDVVMTKPELLAQRLVETISAAGAEVREHTRVRSVSKHENEFQIATESGETFTTTQVVSTLGPWLDSVPIPSHLKGLRPLWCKGFNITISRQIHPTHALGIQSADGRLFFCVPRGTGTSIGTWYVPLKNPLGAIDSHPLSVTEEELAHFIDSFNAVLPQEAITSTDISSVDVGVLPMKHDSRTGPCLYGSEILHATSGYVEVLSTKYTTFRSQGRAAVKALKPLG
jgi:glycerol-3-phosphate dehydrogenase